MKYCSGEPGEAHAHDQSRRGDASANRTHSYRRVRRRSQASVQAQLRARHGHSIVPYWQPPEWVSLDNSGAVGRPLFGQYRAELLQNFREHLRWQNAYQFRVSGTPIQTPYLVCQNDTRYLHARRDVDFIGIAFLLTGDRAKNGQPYFAIIGFWRKNDCWTAACLLMAGLRIERNPDCVTPFGHIGRRGYHTSLPTATPVSLSPCRLSCVT